MLWGVRYVRDENCVNYDLTDNKPISQSAAFTGIYQWGISGAKSNEV